MGSGGRLSMEVKAAQVRSRTDLVPVHLLSHDAQDDGVVLPRTSPEQLIGRDSFRIHLFSNAILNNFPDRFNVSTEL